MTDCEAQVSQVELTVSGGTSPDPGQHWVSLSYIINLQNGVPD